MPVCIAGMHRSGTSMVSRLLNLSGLYLGCDEDMMGASPFNKAGHWENLRFMELNDEILLQLGGAWDLPPIMDDGFYAAPEFLPLRMKAEELLREFTEKEPWGWKDPRNSLTFPFWSDLISEMKVVICLRNPLDVAYSLKRRGSASSNLFGFNLWQIYNKRLLNSLGDTERIVTHYDTYFSDPHRELRRVLDFLEFDVSDESLDKVCEVCDSISSDLRHNRNTIADMMDAGAPSEVLDLYKKLLQEAGPVCRATLGEECDDDTSSADYAGGIKPKDSLLQIRHQHLKIILAEKEEELKRLREELADKEREIIRLRQIHQQTDSYLEREDMPDSKYV